MSAITHLDLDGRFTIYTVNRKSVVRVLVLNRGKFKVFEANGWD
jgi:hypothetical protein